MVTKKTKTYGIENVSPGLGQAQKCGCVKSVNGIPTLRKYAFILEIIL
jgi:hypothetical protein